MNPKLVILIPTTPDRQKLLNKLLNELNHQIGELPVKIIINEDNYQKTTGAKRNELMDSAREIGAEYIAHFDSDDLPGENYIKHNLEGISKGVDCCSLWGQIYFKGRPGKPFHHSIKYDHWFEDHKYYYRNPNHLNCIKLSLLKDIRYKDQTIGEDGHFSIDIHKAGILKTEHEINEVIYHYFK